MTQTHTKNTPEPAAPAEIEHTTYSYESAGIVEHEGNVPAWLWVVIVFLLIWGVYYLVTYWNAPIM